MSYQVSLRERLKAQKKRLEWVLLTLLTAIITTLVSVGVTKALGGGGGLPLPEPPRVLIDAEASLFNPKGNEDGAEEYVCLVNEGEKAVGLTDWKLYDSEGKVDELSQFSLGPGQSIRVHPGGRGSHPNTTHDLYGGEDSHRWDNEGDTATLLDADGEEIFSQEFSARDDGDVSGSCGPPLDSNLGTGGLSFPAGGAAGRGGRGERDCTDFPTQADAQAFFLAHGPREDPYELDADGDGVACES